MWLLVNGINENTSNPHHYAKTASWLVIWLVLFRTVVQKSPRKFLWESPIQSFKCAVLCFFLCSLDFEFSLKFSMKKVLFSRFRHHFVNSASAIKDSHLISYAWVCLFIDQLKLLVSYLVLLTFTSLLHCHLKTVFLSANQLAQMFSSMVVLHFFDQTTHNIQVAKTPWYLDRKSHHFIKAFSSKALVFKQYGPSGRFATRKCSKPLNS